MLPLRRASTAPAVLRRAALSHRVLSTATASPLTHSLTPPMHFEHRQPIAATDNAAAPAVHVPPSPYRTPSRIHSTGDVVLDATAESSMSGQREPRVPHSLAARYVMKELVQAVFRDADTNGDGTVTTAELAAFLSRHRLRHVSASMNGFLAAASSDSLSAADFEALLISTQLVTFDELTHEYGVHRALAAIISEALFQQADANNDGRISLDEVERFCAELGIGDPARARELFVQYDANADEELSPKEFKRLIIGEGLMRVTLSAAQYCRGGL